MDEDEALEVVDEMIAVLVQSGGDWTAIRGTMRSLIVDAQHRGLRIRERLIARGESGLEPGEWADWRDYVAALFEEMGE